MSIPDATDTALAAEARASSPPLKRESPPSVDALKRAQGNDLTDCPDDAGKAVTRQELDEAVAAIEALHEEAALRLAYLRERIVPRWNTKGPH